MDKEGEGRQMESVEMVVCDENQIQEELDRCRVKAETIAMQRYSDAEKMRFAKIIREFNALYWQMKQQTWCNTKWRGVPLCKAPTDMWIYQELVEAIRPDLIIETGSLAGGSALFFHDIIKLMDLQCRVLSIDTVHEHLHTKAKQSDVVFFKGSSVENETMVQVKAQIVAYRAKKIMVILDSDHAKEHVAKELELYAPLVSVGSALVVEDTGNHMGAKEAADEWFMEHEQHGYQYRKDYMCEKFMLTFNRDGYFERVK